MDARNNDFDGLGDYVRHLENIGIDAVIVSDLGVFDTVRKYAPNLEIHISTQSNTTNKYSAGFYKYCKGSLRMTEIQGPV